MMSRADIQRQAARCASFARSDLFELLDGKWPDLEEQVKRCATNWQRISAALYVESSSLTLPKPPKQDGERA